MQNTQLPEMMTAKDHQIAELKRVVSIPNSSFVKLSIAGRAKPLPPEEQKIWEEVCRENWEKSRNQRSKSKKKGN